MNHEKRGRERKGKHIAEQEKKRPRESTLMEERTSKNVKKCS